MPSISTISELTYSNWGPLTTTFTPAPSCTAKPQNVILGIASEPGIEFASVSCQSPDLAGCLPTGSHTTTPAPTSTRGLNPIDVYQASYFSPGIHCPAGWDTVGVASRKGNASVASDGAFRFSTSLPKTIWDATNIGPANGLMQILDPSETAVLCCHSSMTANTWLGCWSTLPEYTVTAACAWRDYSGNVDEVQRTGLLDGTTIVWANLYTITATDVKPFSAYSESFPPSLVSHEDLVGMSVVPIVTLVHQTTDVVATSDATSGFAATGATVGTTSNAAVRGSRGSAWDGIGGVLGAAVGGIVLGAAVILA